MTDDRALAGVRVARLGFGAMHLTGPGVWGPPVDRARAVATLRRAVELGVGLIDTADAYGPATSEELIAEALHPYPSSILVATKGGLVRHGPGHWGNDASPGHLRDACEQSLRRLRLDAIDLYQLHAPDPAVPFDESVGALVELRDAGKIRHIGLSNVGAAQLRAAQRLTPIASVQNEYSLYERSSEDVLRACEADGVAFLPYRPLDVGRRSPARGIARARGVGARQVALAWLLAHSPAMFPIPGTGDPEHLAQNMAAASLTLTPAELRKLDG